MKIEKGCHISYITAGARERGASTLFLSPKEILRKSCGLKITPFFGYVLFMFIKYPTQDIFLTLMVFLLL